VEPDRFLPDDHPYWPGHWASAPQSWAALPEERLIAKEMQGIVAQAIASLPASQRAVISLRDIEGWESDDVCNVVGVSETNQRVLLHRARSKVRRELERYLEGERE
jgi:RNA polymerase sigma-70 factor (ECF subfamily)